MSKASVVKLLSSAFVIAALGVSPAFAADNHKPCNNISKDPVSSDGRSNGSTKVPEPAAMVLMGIGTAGLAAARLRKEGE